MTKVQMKQRILALTAALITLAGNTIPVQAAEAVNAKAATAAAVAAVPVITTFDAIPAETSVIIYENKPALEEVVAALPSTLSVTLDGDPAAVALLTALPVSWTCTGDYAGTDLASYTFTPSWDTSAYTLSPDITQLPYITVMVNAVRSTVYLVAPEPAQSELDVLAKGKDILALIYLCDSYDVKKEPGAAKETLVSVESGQSVRITGVAEDALRNIWFQVSFNLSGADYTGYVERSCLAYADEELLNWEYKHVSSYVYRSSAVSADPYADVNAFPSSYQTALKALKDAHPNWIFVKMETGLDWSGAVSSENAGERSLISSKANASWKKGVYDSSWAYPSDGILAYYMDPRNFLTDASVFQFELLSYNANYHTQAIVQSMLDSTFMNGLIPGDSRTYAEAFYGIGQSMNVSPFHLAARVRVEQGAGASPLISGTYPGYEGYYNYFNIGASGQGAQVITNGLEYARKQSWNTRYLSLSGGSDILSKNYIRVGQDSLYLQKFNVNTGSKYGAFNHQYMQNIAAPSSESSIVYKAYTGAGVINKPFVFKIPVYSNMPGAACSKPAELNEVTLDKAAITMKAGATASLKAFVNGTAAAAGTVAFNSSNTAVATVDSAGTVTALTAGTASITCTQSGGTTAACQVTVQKSEPAYTVPVLGPVTYDPALTLAQIPLPAGWTWDNPATVPTVTVSSYPATFTPADTAAYNTVKKPLTLNVAKGTPAPSSYTVPANLQTIAGNTLASLKLPTGFTWEAPTTVLSSKGTVTGKAFYNPDPANFNTVTGIDITITVVEKAAEECTEHTYGEWEHIADATCTVAGSDTRSCHVCGYKETRALPALGHAYTAAVTKEPTEAETGIRTYTCARCGDAYTEAIDKLPVSHTHSYTPAITKEASCTEKGVKTFTCSCGDTYTEDIAPLGHSYSSGVTKEPTEAEAGVRTFTCSRCGDSYTETIAKLPPSHKHSYTSSVTKEATCTEKGVKIFVCSCGDTYTEDIAAPGHNMSGGKCTRCGYTESSGSSSGSSSNTSNSSDAGGNSTAGVTAPAKTPENTGTDTSKPAPAQAGVPDTAGKASQSSGKASQKSPSDGKDSQKKNTDKGKNVTVNMQKNTVLYEETISSIRGEDVEVILDMGHNISWTINGRNIVYDEANGVDMGVRLEGGNIPASLLARFTGDSRYMIIQLTLAHNGPLDFEPVLTINTAKDQAGRTANLFYYNTETEKLEFTDSVSVTGDGDISFTFTHASDYAIIIGDQVLRDSVITGENATDGDDTASAAPDGGDAEETAVIEKSENKISPVVIIIIVLILLIGTAIGVTIYLMFARKEKADDMKDLESDNMENTGGAVEIHLPKAKDNRKEYLDDDGNNITDDYHEPAIARKSGKITSIKSGRTTVKSSEKKNSFEDDEFDGFE